MLFIFRNTDLVLNIKINNLGLKLTGKLILKSMENHSAATDVVFWIWLEWHHFVFDIDRWYAIVEKDITKCAKMSEKGAS